MNAQDKIQGTIASITKLTPKKGQESMVLDAAKYIQKQASIEEGCLFFSLNTEKSHPDIVVMFEIFKDQNAFDFHKKQEHTRYFSELLKGKLEKNDVLFLKSIENVKH